MAALQCYVNCPSTSLTASTAQTAVQLKAASNQRVKVLGYGFYFDGTSNSAQPVQIVVQRQTTAGTATSATPKFVEKELSNSGGPTIQTTAQITFTAEPTYGDVLKTITVHPQLGYEYLAPLGQEDIIQGGGYMGWTATAPASVDIRGYVKFEE
jgi:hypothetical protein